MDSCAGDPVWCSDSPAERIALIAALELEAAIPRSVLRERCPPALVSGPGSERAGATARRAIAAGARALIAFGLAGGLAEPAATGAIALPRIVLGPGGEWPVDEVWRSRLAQRLGARFALTDLPLFSADSVVTTAAGKAELAARTGAAVIDMESAAVAAAAAEAGVAFIALRVVADGPADSLPDRVALLVTADGRTRYRALLGYLLPGRGLGLLVALARRSGQARRVLAQVVTALAEPAG